MFTFNKIYVKLGNPVIPGFIPHNLSLSLKSICCCEFDDNDVADIGIFIFNVPVDHLLLFGIAEIDLQENNNYLKSNI